MKWVKNRRSNLIVIELNKLDALVKSFHYKEFWGIFWESTNCLEL
jgi:hypothetical protein